MVPHPRRHRPIESKRFDVASERGHWRDDIRSGLRIVRFERRVTVAFTVDNDRVRFLRIFYGGWDWENGF
jgi:toxin ParE1/3/4